MELKLHSVNQDVWSQHIKESAQLCWKLPKAIAISHSSIVCNAFVADGKSTEGKSSTNSSWE